MSCILVTGFTYLASGRILRIMPGSVNIMSFFKPVASKRPITDVADGKEDLNESEKKVSSGAGVMRKIKDLSDKFSALHSNIGETWFSALEKEFGKEYFQKLSAFLAKERLNGAVFPPADRVWSWTRMCPIAEVKVVVLGQDPYHGPGQAHGLSFSVPKGVIPPPSLKNIYKELEADVPGFKIPDHGHLVGWAEQGVLLLNACLTVRCHAANSHKDQGWETFTDAVIRYISNHSKGVVFLLWGAYAQKKAAFVDSSKHHLLKSVHPSPLSAHRGFIGCKHFSKCNELLVKQGKKPIDWAHLP